MASILKSKKRSLEQEVLINAHLKRIRTEGIPFGAVVNIPVRLRNYTRMVSDIGVVIGKADGICEVALLYKRHHLELFQPLRVFCHLLRHCDNQRVMIRIANSRLYSIRVPESELEPYCKLDYDTKNLGSKQYRDFLQKKQEIIEISKRKLSEPLPGEQYIFDSLYDFVRKH